MKKILGIMQLIRPINCLITGSAVLVGAIVANQSLAFNNAILARMTLGLVTGFTFLASANAVNDYYDRKIDAVNEPHRPIPRGIITPSEALLISAVLSVAGFVAAFLTNTSALALATVSWVLFTYYATKGKRTGFLGNVIVSGCLAIPFIYGSFIITENAKWTLSPATIAIAGMAFFSTIGREITKGIIDVEGDRLEEAKTVAILYGEEKAALSAALFYTAAVILSLFPVLFTEVSSLYLPFVTIADAGFIFSSNSLIHNHSRESARRVKNMVRIWMVIGLFAFIMAAL